MKNILIIILILYPFCVMGQINFDRGLIEVQKFCLPYYNYSVDSNSKGYNAFVSDGSGGFYAVGATGGACDTFQNSEQNRNLLVARFDANMNELWYRCYGGSGAEGADEIFRLPSGNLIIFGVAENMDGDVHRDTTKYYDGLLKGWLLKLDSNGNYIDDALIGGNGVMLLNYAFMSPEFYIYMTGSTSATQGDITGVPNYPFYVGCIASVDTNLNHRFGKRYDWKLGKYLRGLSFSPSGNVYVSTQITEDSFSVFDPPLGDDDGGIIKMDNMGNVIWARRYGGTDADWFLTMDYVPEWNEFILNGMTYSYDMDIWSNNVSDSTINSTGCAMWLARMDTLGNLKMSRGVGNPTRGISMGGEYLGRKNGLVYVGANSGHLANEAGGLVPPEIDNFDHFIWIGGWDSSGVFRLMYHTDYRYLEDAWGGRVLENGDFILSGNTEHVIHQPHVVNPYSCNGSLDTIDFSFILKLEEAPLYVENVDKSSAEQLFELFPNPTSADIQVRKTAEAHSKCYTLKITDINGKLLERGQSLCSDLESIDLVSYSSGIYFFQILEKDKILETHKVIKN